MTLDEIEEAFVTHLRNEFGAPQDLTPDTTLFSSTLLGSTDIVELVLLMEEKFDIDVPGQDVTLDNFDSAGRMAAYVLGRRSSKA